MSKTAVVFTATGAQGASVVKSLLEGGWKVIGLTRDTKSSSAQALAKQGVEVSTGDLADPKSYSDVLKGADAAFVNADFWTIFKKTGDANAAAAEETKQAKNAIQAALDAGVGHVLYSTLDGGHGAKHWDSKAAVSNWTRAQGYPVTNLYLSYYINVVAKAQMLKPTGDGGFQLTFPVPDDTKLPGTPVEQIGLWVRAAFENPDKYRGKDLQVATDDSTLAEIAKTLSELSGKKVSTLGLSREAFFSDGLRQQLSEELHDNWKLFVEGNVKRDVAASRAIVKGSWDFRDWAAQDEYVKKTLGF